MNGNDIKEKNIYDYQSLADKEPLKVKVTQVHEYKKKIRVEVSRDLVNCLNPFRIDSTELK